MNDRALQIRRDPHLTRCTIRCDNEQGLVISSEMEEEAWKAIERLMPLLRQDRTFLESLFSWKQKASTIASARETYSWRGAIDLIKENDLGEKCGSLKEDPEILFLMKSKPIMLRMAGEITNALIHSYNLQHRITFTQRVSAEPS